MEDDKSLKEWWKAHMVAIITGSVFAVVAVVGGIFMVYYGTIIFGQAGKELILFTRCMAGLQTFEK